MTLGLAGRLWTSYGDIRAGFRAERAAGPSEARLLFYVTLASALLFAARLPGLMAAGPARQAAAEGALAAYAGALLVAHVFFAPLLLYGIAALARLGARAAGGRGNWRESRLALFWALLLAVPAVLLAHAAVTLGGLGGSAAARALDLLPGLAFLWIWALCLAEAEGFRRPGLVFLALAVVPIAALAATLAAGRLGQG